MSRIARIAEGNWAEVDLERVPSAEPLVEEIDNLRDEDVHAVVLHGQPLWEPSDDGLSRLSLAVLPTIFAFEGELSGTALAVALHCDIRVCGAAASIRLESPEQPRLRQLLRRNLSVGVLAAADALEAGLVSRVAPAGEGLEAARSLARVVASRGPIAVQLGKEAIWRGLTMPLDQALRFETDLTLLLQTTKDRAEGVAAFLEKRPPRFAGE